MNETNEHNPDGLTPEQYGAPEWRLLKVGETVYGSDEVDMSTSGSAWRKVDFALAVMSADDGIAVRRRVSPTLAEQSQRRAEGSIDAVAKLEAGEQILWNQLAERDEVNAQLRARIAELERRVEELTEENGELRGKLNRECANHDAARDDADVRAGQILALRAEVERLTKERDEARAWQAEIRDAIQRSGMGIMRTSQGLSGTMLGYRPEVEEEHERKTLEVIHENVDLAAEVRTLKTQLAEREEDRALLDWLSEIAKSARDATAVIFAPLGPSDFWRIEYGNMSFADGDTLRAAIRAARAQPEEKA